jgi:hypothetical protein
MLEISRANGWPSHPGLSIFDFPVMKTRVALLLLTTLLSARFLAAATPTQDEALAAIKTLDEHLLSDAATNAAKVITQFAQQSKQVTLTLGVDTTPWLLESPTPDKETRAVNALLLGVYIAGNTKAQLAAKKAEDDPYSGWLAVIHAYPVLQAANKFSSPSIERFIRQEAAGRLKQHAEDVKLKNLKADQAVEASPARIVVPTFQKP